MRDRNQPQALSSQANYVPESTPDPNRQMSIIEENLEVSTPDGVTDALLVRPESNDPLPAVITFTDIFGLRPAFAEQSRRIAERGYVVLTPNIFYRVSKLPIFPFEPDFGSDRTRERSRELTAPLRPAAMERDGSAYVDFL